MRIGYENDKQMELFTEHHGYDVLEYTANANLVAKNISNHEELDASDYDGNGNFIGARSDPMLFLIGNYNVEEDDQEVDIIDPIYKVVKANYGVAHGYRLWYYKTDSESLLVYYGRDISIGRCASKNKLRKNQEKDKEKGKGKMGEKDKENGKGKLGEKDEGNGNGKMGEKNDDDGQIRFSRLYVCYKGLKDGWIAGCRRLIGIDGCFLTHNCK
nr:hypothetical protein [Tanacetum cinerariifolium]